MTLKYILQYKLIAIMLLYVLAIAQNAKPEDILLPPPEIDTNTSKGGNKIVDEGGDDNGKQKKATKDKTTVFSKKNKYNNLTYDFIENSCSNCDGEMGGFTINVKDEKNVSVSTSVISNGTYSISDVEFYEKKVLVVGSLNSSIKIVTIIDVATLKVITYFYCFNPSISPSKRYIIFKKFYPRFGPSELQTDLYLAVSMLSDEYMGVPPESIGTPLYPKKNADNASYDVYAPSFSQSHMAITDISWKKEVDWAYCTELYNGNVYVLIFDFSDHNDMVKVSYFVMDFSDELNQLLKVHTNYNIQDALKAVFPTHIAFFDNNVVYSYAISGNTKEITIPLSDFKTYSVNLEKK